NLLSRLGFQLGICMDLDTRRSASRNKAVSDNIINRFTVVDEPSIGELEKLDGLLMKNLGNSAFHSGALCKQLGLSRSQVHRKISSLFGKPPNGLWCETRLIYAIRALKKGRRSVSEIAYDSGFNSPTYFTRVFRKRFDIPPTLVGKALSK